MFSKLDKKFLIFHEKNPHIYENLVILAREAKSSGKNKIGIKMIWEVMRWQLFLQTTDPDGWKLNNDFPSRYSRLIMHQEEDLQGLFETRKLRS